MGECISDNNDEDNDNEDNDPEEESESENLHEFPENARLRY